MKLGKGEQHLRNAERQKRGGLFSPERRERRRLRRQAIFNRLAHLAGLLGGYMFGTQYVGWIISGAVLFASGFLFWKYLL